MLCVFVCTTVCRLFETVSFDLAGRNKKKKGSHSMYFTTESMFICSICESVNNLLCDCGDYLCFHV